ncbi:MAG: hypothetical protein N2578_05885, partial [Bdellovibrionaceae bacterium]|nr:hypothetical protein [Pseudobdellovibrionaceae bacterium]
FRLCFFFGLRDHFIEFKVFLAVDLSFAVCLYHLWIQFIRGPLTDAEKNEIKELLPPLLRAYIKIGAYVGGEPAWDDEFQCIDFLTVLQKEDLNMALWKKFKLESGESPR